MAEPQHAAHRVVAEWWNGETLIRIPHIARYVAPQHDGRPVSAATCWRWTLRGLDGVRIRRFRSAGSWATTAEEVQRWLATLTFMHEQKGVVK